MERNYINIYSGLFFFIFSIVIFIQVNDIEALTDDLIGSDFLPKVTSILIAITSVFIFISGLSNKKEQLEESESKSNKHESDRNDKKDYLLVLYSIIYILLYVFLISYIDILITTCCILFNHIHLF